MTLKITLGSGKKGVDFNKGYKEFFTDFEPSGSPEFLGPTPSETTQIVHLATPEPGKEKLARAVLLDGEDFQYTFANHTVSGEIDTISLVRLGKAYDGRTGELVLEDGVVKSATPFIVIDDVDVSNPAGQTGPVHDIVAGMMGGGPSGTQADPSAITEILWGEAHDVRGSAGNDRYAGTKFGDVIRGLGGADTLNGRGGNDKLIGGLGADSLTGGKGADTFVFNTLAETRGDVIEDFRTGQGDRLKLTGIDADKGHGGNQAFSFIGTDGFHGEAGELRYRAGGERTVVAGDVDGDGVGDFRIILAGEVVLTADDILL